MFLLWQLDDHQHHKAGRRSNINQFAWCVPSLDMNPLPLFSFCFFLFIFLSENTEYR